MAANSVDEKTFEAFKQQAEALSASVYRTNNYQEAVNNLNSIIKEKNVKKIVAASSGMVNNCLEKIQDEGVEINTGDLQWHAREAGLGISEMEMAIAETGTVVQDSSRLEQRLVSTLPPVHVVLMPTESIVKTFNEAVDKLNEKYSEIPGYIAFISGPSRTADIERVLTIGVHGPEQLHIIFVDGAGGEPGE